MGGLRIALLAVGGLLFVVGLLGIADGIDPGGAATVMLTGAALILAVTLERQRYRSQAAERAGEAPGPGGGEAPEEAIPGAFRQTDEVFVDPTSGHRMRVWVDPRTGERRYRAEA